MAEIPKNHFVTAKSPIFQKLPNFVGTQNPRGTLCPEGCMMRAANVGTAAARTCDDHEVGRPVRTRLFVRAALRAPSRN